MGVTEDGKYLLSDSFVIFNDRANELTERLRICKGREML